MKYLDGDSSNINAIWYLCQKSLKVSNFILKMTKLF